MKKIIAFLTLFLVFFISDVKAVEPKYNVRTKMYITSEKAMTYQINMTLNTEFMFKYDVNVDDIFNRSSYEISVGDKGYTVDLLISNIDSGLQISKTFQNIDAITTSKKLNIDLTKIDDEKFTDKVLFQKKKGLLYDKYIGNFAFDYRHIKKTEDISLKDLKAMMNLGLEVNLPVSATKYNANVINDDKNNLVWNFEIGKINNVNFEYKVVNMTNLIIILAISAILIITMLVFIVKKTSGKLDEMKETRPKKENKPKKEKINKNVFNNGMVEDETNIPSVEQYKEETHIKKEHVSLVTEDKKIDLMAPMQPTNNSLEQPKEENIKSLEQPIFNENQNVVPLEKTTIEQPQNNIYNQAPVQQPTNDIFSSQPVNAPQPTNDIFNSQPVNAPQPTNNLFSNQPVNAPNAEQTIQEAPDYTDIFNQTFKDDK